QRRFDDGHLWLKQEWSEQFNGRFVYENIRGESHVKSLFYLRQYFFDGKRVAPQIKKIVMPADGPNVENFLPNLLQRGFLGGLRGDERILQIWTGPRRFGECTIVCFAGRGQRKRV